MHSPLRAPARAVAAASIASLALLTGAATADAACSSTSTTKAFAKFGDTADYSLAPGGSFESGATGWSLGGASVVNGNEPFFLGSPSHTKSLAVPSKAVATSAAFCVGVEHPTFRFVARRTSGTWGVLNVKLRVKNAAGGYDTTTVGALSGDTYSRWAPSPALHLATVLSLWAAGQSATVQIVLDPEDSGGSWQVDDLYIDPYRRS